MNTYGDAMPAEAGRTPTAGRPPRLAAAARGGRAEDSAGLGVLALSLLAALVGIGLALVGLALLGPAGTAGGADIILEASRTLDETETEAPWTYEAQDWAQSQLLPGAVYSR